jgi:RNase_H superfamily
MSIVTFDLETTEDMKQITCAAVCEYGHKPVTFYSGDGVSLIEPDIMDLLDYLYQLHEGYNTIITWNGASFDFKLIHSLISSHPSLTKVVKEITRAHVDYMYFIFCCLGYPVSLENACAGTKVPGKSKYVTLKDGSKAVAGGAQAPLLWDAGETNAVLEYLCEDVSSLMRLAVEWRYKSKATWLSKSGKLKTLDMRTPSGDEVELTVDYCNSIPVPDTSWMTSPKSRNDFTGWLKE